MQIWPGIKIVFRRRRIPKKSSTKAYLDNKRAARTLILARLEYFNLFYNYPYKRIAIRDTKRSWGSCSSQKNLNFSYKLLFLPACLRDYVIVHELCHLKELHHQQSFWNEVARIMPDCKVRASALRTFERNHGTSLAALQKFATSHVHCNACADGLSIMESRFMPPQTK